MAPLPSDKPVKLQALSAYHNLDTPSELQVDVLTLLASHICHTSSALTSHSHLVRQWLKSTVGISASGTPHDIALCPPAILEQQLLVVRDAATDLRFAENPLVTKDPHIWFCTRPPWYPTLVMPEARFV